MSVFLGSKPEYSPVSGYAEIQGDMAEVNSTIWVNEGRVIKGDDGYAFCMVADRISDLGRSDSFIAGTQVCWIAHNKAYTRWTKENPKLPVEPTPLEKALTQWLDTDGQKWLSKSFKGKLHLMGNERIVESIIANKSYQLLIDDWQECEVDLIKEISFKGSGNKSKSNYSGQTEAQKFVDRKTEMMIAAGIYGKNCENDLSLLAISLTAMKHDMPEAFEIFMQLLNIAKG